MSGISCKEPNSTESITEQCLNFEDYRGNILEGSFVNPIYQQLMEIINKGAKSNISNLRGTEISLVTKHVNEVRNSSEQESITRASALFVCQQVWH